MIIFIVLFQSAQNAGSSSGFAVPPSPPAYKYCRKPLFNIPTTGTLLCPSALAAYINMAIGVLGLRYPSYPKRSEKAMQY